MATHTARSVERLNAYLKWIRSTVTGNSLRRHVHSTTWYWTAGQTPRCSCIVNNNKTITTQMCVFVGHAGILERCMHGSGALPSKEEQGLDRDLTGSWTGLHRDLIDRIPPHETAVYQVVLTWPGLDQQKPTTSDSSRVGCWLGFDRQKPSTREAVQHALLRRSIRKQFTRLQYEVNDHTLSFD